MSAQLESLLVSFDTLFNSELLTLGEEEIKIVLHHLQQHINNVWKTMETECNQFHLTLNDDENQSITIENITEDNDIASETECEENFPEKSSNAEERTDLLVYLDENNVSFCKAKKNHSESIEQLFDVEEREIPSQDEPGIRTDREIKVFNITEDSDLPYGCVECGKHYKSKSGVRHHHAMVHSVEDPGYEEAYACSKEGCTYTTTKRRLWKVHMYSHANNAPLTCPICNKDYLGGPKALKEHMKIHIAKRDYKCSLCEKLFISQSRLNYHIQNVHSEPSFHCDQCSKMFRSKVNFNRHMRIHSDEKPFQCPYCSFDSNHSTNLTSHVRSIHKEKNFTTGKEHKQKKKDQLVKDIIENRTSDSILSLLGDGEVDYGNVSQNLGQNLLQDLTQRGVLPNLVSQPIQPAGHAGVHTPRKPSKPVSFLKTAKSDKMITVRNSEGLLVKAVVKVKTGKNEGDKVLHVCVKD